MVVKVATARLPDPLPAGTVEAALRRQHPECRVAHAQFEKMGSRDNEYIKYITVDYWVRFDVTPQFELGLDLETVNGYYHVRLARIGDGEWSALFKIADWIGKWAAAIVAQDEAQQEAVYGRPQPRNYTG